uniref:Uncharacterized protein n=1 Tax=Daucus carota subsp. sativus TaxID=79200 RepID=A0A166A498_DAUCS
MATAKAILTALLLSLFVLQFVQAHEIMIVKGNARTDATYHRGQICAIERVEHAVRAVTVFLRALLGMRMSAHVMLI